MADETPRPIEQSSLWARNGKRYVVISLDYTTKDADAANWSRAVVHQIEDASEPVRVRTESDFREKFERVD